MPFRRSYPNSLIIFGQDLLNRRPGPDLAPVFFNNFGEKTRHGVEAPVRLSRPSVVETTPGALDDKPVSYMFAGRYEPGIIETDRISCDPFVKITYIFNACF